MIDNHLLEHCKVTADALRDRLVSTLLSRKYNTDDEYPGRLAQRVVATSPSALLLTTYIPVESPILAAQQITLTTWELTAQNMLEDGAAEPTSKHSICFTSEPLDGNLCARVERLHCYTHTFGIPHPHIDGWCEISVVASAKDVQPRVRQDGGKMVWETPDFNDFKSKGNAFGVNFGRRGSSLIDALEVNTSRLSHLLPSDRITAARKCDQHSHNWKWIGEARIWSSPACIHVGSRSVCRSLTAMMYAHVALQRYRKCCHCHLEFSRSYLPSSLRGLYFP